MQYGYVRVSAKDQNPDRQIRTLTASGIELDQIVIDRQSGKDFDREQYQLLMKKIKPGDLLVVTSLDRLGRNYREMMREWQRIIDNHIDIKVLDCYLLDTTLDTDKNLTGRVICDVFLRFLSYVAQIERDNIRERQAQGIAAAKARGKKWGRKPLPKPDSELFESVKEKWVKNEISGLKAGKVFGVSRNTFIRWVNEDEEEKKSLV
jgi:DNA invertase Pin-like site-specific DNA recombinase